MERHKITMLFTMPTVYLRISKTPEAAHALRHVVGAIAGGSPMDGKLQQAANPKFGNGTDVYIGQTWGLSESTGGITGMPIGFSDVTGCISSPIPGVEIRIVDDAYNDVEPGKEGELLIRSPTVMKGYINDPESTKNTFHGEWLCTGDIGVFKDDKMYIVDRKKVRYDHNLLKLFLKFSANNLQELLKFRGLQIAPAELENLLSTHPWVKEAAVVGIPAPEDPGSDLPRAYVVADPSNVSEDDLKDFVKDNVAPYKQLRGGVVFVDAIPKNAVGKYLRKGLKERAMKEIGAVRAKL